MTVTNNGSTFTDEHPEQRRRLRRQRLLLGAYANNNPFTATYPSRRPDAATSQVSPAAAATPGQLTIAAENDIIIEDDIRRSGDGMLGLIANNFVRVKHPICPSSNLGCSNGTVTAQTAKGSCNGGVNGTGSQSNLRDRRRDPRDPALVHRRPLRLRRARSGR